MVMDASLDDSVVCLGGAGMGRADVLGVQSPLLLEGELKNTDSSSRSPASTRLSAGNLTLQ